VPPSGSSRSTAFYHAAAPRRPMAMATATAVSGTSALLLLLLRLLMRVHTGSRVSNRKATAVPPPQESFLHQRRGPRGCWAPRVPLCALPPPSSTS
jgi:hypothetical protein